MVENESEERNVNLRSCEVLFELFIREFPSLKLDWNAEWGEWTTKILTFFAKLGKKYGYQIYLKPDIGVLDLEKQPTTEYLVDLCWSFEDESERGSWIELALESELSGRDIDSILTDFNKLVDVKAYMKVGIFSPKLADRHKALEQLRNIVAYSGIRVPSERYLVIFILYHGKAEKASERIEIVGYEINYLGDSRKISSKRFPASIKNSRT